MQSAVDGMSKLVLTQNDEHIQAFCRGKFSKSNNESLKAAILRKFFHPFRTHTVATTLPTTKMTTAQSVTEPMMMVTDGGSTMPTPSSLPINEAATTTIEESDAATTDGAVTDGATSTDELTEMATDPITEEITLTTSDEVTMLATSDAMTDAETDVATVTGGIITEESGDLRATMTQTTSDAVETVPVDVTTTFEMSTLTTTAMQTDEIPTSTSESPTTDASTETLDTTSNMVDDKLDILPTIGTVDKQNIRLLLPFSYNVNENQSA